MSSLSKLFRVSIIYQFISIATGILRATIVPLYLGLVEFGYWQIYLLYVGLLGVLSLGYIDGIYLNYGGVEEHKLPFNKLRSAGIVYFFASVFISLLLCVVIYTTVQDESKKTALLYLLPNVLLVGLTSYYLMLFQITNQIYKYSRYLILDKLLFISVLPLLIFFGKTSFESLILLDIASRFFLILLLILKYHYFIFGERDDLSLGLKFFITNINDGIKLLFANMAGMFLLVLGRLYVERNYSISEFSTYAFGVSVTNVILMAVGAISVVLYPALKKLNSEEYSRFFVSSTRIIDGLLILALLSYFPMYYFVENYMYNYKGVLQYLNLLLVVCLIQIKIQVLLNTFYKVLRQERKMLFDNLSTIAFSCVLLLFVNVFSNSVYMVVFVITIAMFSRMLFSEIYLKKLLSLNVYSTLFLPPILFLFIFVTHYFEFWVGFVSCCGLSLIYFLTSFNIFCKKVVS